MLAFILWHRHTTQIDAHAYRERLLRFHQALADHPPAGFIASRVFHSTHLPWTGSASEAWEDWYLLENSAAIETLNGAAITGACAAVHDDIAGYSRDEVTGLYRLRDGDSAAVAVPHALWIDRPAGVRHAEFLERLRPLAGGGSLWTRMMGLSPAPEFCLLTPEPVATAVEGSVVQTARLPVWPAA